MNMYRNYRDWRAKILPMLRGATGDYEYHFPTLLSNKRKAQLNHRIANALGYIHTYRRVV